ncbi:Glyoxalase/bleomycin resistance protein/dioxygenase [Gluconacetobacter diazotrophicus PA1 5]|uniref:VOC family protein n=2 Tax=Gluconacetobacter diazotrophicus TaxID=33996 RepID=A0A7W4FEP9_GLUDI|nr:VOC family protein [Gluconacetobacter diazotrophicus]ACI50931.1 Glyoxalase/bleomycin resistance protein/dioxygenase [Gluconacetobacter diazotrophicus PA1 5]MBB2156134.1 VOC family protein [Gluconacetobacter diazotrophicus]TWB08614.1 catechol 2,3-dioxygenase-like lactoylglutathione lyase family enzyme [Gluconacetobacter diazotrophicus]CAP54814.1 putative glyoxalase [Gluconacetobacter diazotrophicus PA1 5]
MRFTVDRLDHVVITVRDLEVSASWYQRVLGMEREEYGRNNRTALKFGGQKINLRPHGAEGWSTATDALPGTNDLCFITAVASDDVVEHLQGCGVTVTEGPVARLGALGPVTSVYCEDPDGNLVEIASYQG